MYKEHEMNRNTNDTPLFEGLEARPFDEIVADFPKPLKTGWPLASTDPEDGPIKERQVRWLNWFYGPEGPGAEYEEPISGDDTARCRAYAAITGDEAVYRYGVDVDTGDFSPQCCCGKNTEVYTLAQARTALGRP